MVTISNFRLVLSTLRFRYHGLAHLAEMDLLLMSGRIFSSGDNEFVDINQVVYVRVNDDENFEFDVKREFLEASDIEEDNLNFRIWYSSNRIQTTKGLTNVLTGTNKINSLM